MKKIDPAKATLAIKSGLGLMALGIFGLICCLLAMSAGLPRNADAKALTAFLLFGFAALFLAASASVALVYLCRFIERRMARLPLPTRN